MSSHLMSDFGTSRHFPAPLKLVATRDGLATLALTRRQEIDGFIEGLFGGKEAVDLPERAHRGVGVLGEMRALIAGVHNLASNQMTAAKVTDTEGTLRQIGELTKIGEHEISCGRAILYPCPATDACRAASKEADNPLNRPAHWAAALEGPPKLSGLTAEMRTDIERALLKAHHAQTLSAMEDRQEALDVVGSAAEIAIMEVRNHVGLAPHEFDTWFATADGSDKARAA